MKTIPISDSGLYPRLEKLAKETGYKTQISGGLLIENSLTEPVFAAKVCDVDNPPSKSDIFENNSKQFGETSYGIRFSECQIMIEELVNNITHTGFEKLKNSIYFCPTIKLKEFFQSSVEPIFFGVFPKGKIISISSNRLYYKRQAFQRLLYAVNQYPNILGDLAGSFEGFPILRHWITIDPHEMLNDILLISAYAFCPFVGFVTGSHGLGLKFIFVLDREISYQPDQFPSSWMEYPLSSADFAQEELDDIHLAPERRIFGKYVFNNPLKLDSRLELVNWSIDKVDELVRVLCDATQFNEKNDPIKIDPIYGLEYGFSFSHLLKLGLSIIGSRGKYINKSFLFQIADIMAAMAKAGDLSFGNEAEFAKGLFQKNVKGNQVISILLNSKVKGLTLFSKALDQVYDKYEKTIIDSIWYTSKSTSTGISVKRRDLVAETIIPKSQFSGEITRALRNSHHGYFTRNDPRGNRPSRYLSIITGEIPDDAPSLAIGWILALLESRQQLIGNP